MTEIEAVYLDKPLHVGVKFLRCPKCDSEYGHEIEGGAYLRIGTLKVQRMMAFCGCGQVLHWNAADRHLKKIVERRRKNA